ncbi:MAG: hypothetical protein M0036_22105 [Desulfobacteraceae bacterium]|nr:hypothetical protein [Desulfobacteraceae bacterium]
MFEPLTRKWEKTTFTKLFLLAVISLALAACGGGGGSSSGTPDNSNVSALTLPDRITLTNVDQSTGAPRSAHTLRGILSRAAARGAYNDAGTDYSNAAKRTWVEDTDALDMINTVLGVCADTAYSNFVNQGPYLALVRDKDKKQESQSGDTTTSTTTEELMEIIVDVTRASNSAPMIVKIWLYVNGPEDMPMLVRGYFTVSQGVSAEYPFGAMTAHFKGNLVGQDDSIGLEVMHMALGVGAEDGNVVMENVDDEGSDLMPQSLRHRYVRVVANPDMSLGNAYVSKQEWDWNANLMPDPTISHIAFNSTHFKDEIVGGATTVYAKDNFTRRIYRYQLFDAATGAAVSLNSGFPIQTADGKNGYLGYYGLWINNNGTVDNGATVTDKNGNAYTVFKATGKLTKHTASSMPLGNLTNVELSKFSCDQNGCMDQTVRWNGSNFEKIGTRDQQTGQIVYDDTPTPLSDPAFNQWEGAWCESLKAFLRLGILYYDQNGSPITPTDDSTVYFHTEQTVDPSMAAELGLDGVPLYTWSYTMDADASGIVQDDLTNYMSNQNSYWGHETEKTFYFDPATMIRKYSNGHAVTIAGLTVPNNSPMQGGYSVGPLTTGHYYNNQSPYFWEANNAQTYYTWNSGNNQWNQYVTVRDGQGNFASFDPPLSFQYTHSTANDANSSSANNGKTYRLEYDGFSLNMPWTFDPVTGQWMPQINLADGTELTDGNGTYVVKGLEQALIMSSVADPGGLDYTEVGPPELTYDSTKTDLVGTAPTGVVLKVIKGEVIE